MKVAKIRCWLLFVQTFWIILSWFTVHRITSHLWNCDKCKFYVLPEWQHSFLQCSSFVLHLNHTFVCPNKTWFCKDFWIYCVAALTSTHRNLSEGKFVEFLKFGNMQWFDLNVLWIELTNVYWNHDIWTM
jgi:hypothetical protein